MDFMRICAIFCCHWGSTFSGRNNQAIGPRLSAIFTCLVSMYFVESCNVQARKMLIYKDKNETLLSK